TALGPGPHQLQVTKDGFVPYQVEVQVVPGHTASVEARLDREPPRLWVDADVPGARVFLDRRFVGTTPLDTREVPPGPHQLDVSADGFDIHGEAIELGPGGREVMVRFKEVRLDETLPVTHKHGVGSCRGTLSATTAGLRFQAADPADDFRARFADLEPLQVDYLKKNLRVKLRGGRTYNFTADSAAALLAFQQAVEAARKRI
ncbi:MAG TPA: PEGA domain-containing protein, partial [Vicinamibacteria bacterium]|nr:PEGA domain-containing protein [Vicinamibacteria bacterium]